MKKSILKLSIVSNLSIVSILYMLVISCAPIIPRAVITFDYAPLTESNSTDITLAIISTQREVPGTLLNDFSNNLNNDVVETLAARGLGFRGSFRSYRELTDQDKSESDLIVVIDVEFSSDITKTHWETPPITVEGDGSTERWNITGPASFNGSVNLIVIDSLTTEIFKTEKVEFQPIAGELKSITVMGKFDYPTGFAQSIMGNRSAHLGVFADFLEKDNEFHSTVGTAFSRQYIEIMNSIYDYLDPEFLASLVPPPEPDRAKTTFDYTPPEEAKPNSAGATFAVVGATFETPVPLYSNFTNSMADDFGEILTARGYGLKGPYKTFNEILYPDKLASNLILTTEVKFDTDRTQIKWSPVEVLYRTEEEEHFRASGEMVVKGRVNLVVSESLTNETMWTRSIAITPKTIKLVSRENYPSHANLVGQLEHDNKFHEDVGNALLEQYNEIMKTIYDYLHPGEMALIMKAAADARKRATISQ